MNWAWATSLDQIWRSPAFPMWLTLAAAGFFGVIALDHAVARREIGRQRRADGDHAAGHRHRGRRHHSRDSVRAARQRPRPMQPDRPQPMADAALPALSCIDDLAGEIGSGGLREGAVRLRRSRRGGAVLCGVPDHPADRARRRRGREREHDARIASAAPRGRARPLRADGLCAAWRATIARRRIARRSGR